MSLILKTTPIQKPIHLVICMRFEFWMMETRTKKELKTELKILIYPQKLCYSGYEILQIICFFSTPNVIEKKTIPVFIAHS